jgi:hypothetical protein
VLGISDAQGDTLADFAGKWCRGRRQPAVRGLRHCGAGRHLHQADATHWTINSANGLAHETVTFSNGAAIHPSDYQFV